MLSNRARAPRALPLLLMLLSCVGSGYRLHAEDAGGPMDTHSPFSAPLAGHSLHGEAFNEGPRGAATLLKGMPRVHFPVTSAHPEVQSFINQGVGQLHGFWYFEAERSFRQAAKLDPDCPLAFWGMAMANVNNATRAREFIAQAVARKSKASPREQRWIDALADYHRERETEGDKKERPEKDRRRNYVRALESLVQDFPEDLEAKAFLAVQVWDNAGFGNERPLAITSHQAVDTLLEQIFTRDPLHPAHHYRIHLWDNEKPARALGAAGQGGPSGPGIAHLWHMPGHTYDKFQRYADAAWQQEASARVDHAHMIRARILPDQIHNYAHNQEWLSRSLSHLGRVPESLAIARNLAELPRHPKWNHLGKGGSSSSYGRWRLAATLLRWELWDQAIAETHPDTGHLNPSDNREHNTLRLFTLGLAQTQLHGTNAALPTLTELESIRTEVSRDRLKAAEDAEAKARRENKDRESVGRAMTEALQGYEKDVLPLDEAIAELRAWEAAARQDTNQVKERLALVKSAPKSRLAYLWLRAGDPDQAIRLATEAAEKSTNQLHELAVRADVLWQAGRTNEAREAFAKVRPAAAFADLELPVLKRLQPLAVALGLPADWRTPYVTPPDLGPRPDLDTLGPRLWQPSKAPAWQFANTDNQPVSSTQYAGRAHLLIYYLGHGCSHCIEQLKAFGPLAADFKTAGIELIAVSLDSPTDLPRTARRAGTDGHLDITVLSDASRTGFRAYGTYDDFEDIPLHGAFLVDATGQVRWQDIGHEPFTDAKFLLSEARRLLRPGRLSLSAAVQR
jgi:peroxiredoxin/tetratricopeptide (TPR) repeat protein